MLHQVSTAIVKWCKEKGYGLIHEDLKGLRNAVNRRVKRFNKFNGGVQLVSKHSNKLRRRLNSWWFRRFPNQISYKCKWEGVKAIESGHTKGSSSTCPICGCKLSKYPNGLVECERHGLMDRHIVACLNLLRWEAVVQPQPLLKCSCEPSPNKPYGDEDKLGEQKRRSNMSGINRMLQPASSTAHVTEPHQRYSVKMLTSEEKGLKRCALVNSETILSSSLSSSLRLFSCSFKVFVMRSRHRSSLRRSPGLCQRSLSNSSHQ